MIGADISRLMVPYLLEFGVEEMSYDTEDHFVVFKWRRGTERFRLRESNAPYVDSEWVGSWPLKYTRETLDYSAIEARLLEVLQQWKSQTGGEG